MGSGLLGGLRVRSSWMSSGVCRMRLSLESNHILGAPNLALECSLIAPGDARRVVPLMEASMLRVSSRRSVM